MSRGTPFSVGRRWFCQGSGRNGPFHFVIIGPGHRKDWKRCRIELVNHDPPDRFCAQEKDPFGRCARYGMQCPHGVEQDYPHRHLKKYALVEEAEETKGIVA